MRVLSTVNRLIPWALSGLAFLAPAVAHAVDPFQIISGTFGAVLPTNCPVGGCGVIALAYSLVMQIRPFITMIAGLIIVIQGMRMVISQEDNYTDRVKATITACLAGIVTMYLIPPFIDTFYGNAGSVWNNREMVAGASVAAREVTGLINWALTIVAIVAVAMIVVTGVRAIAQSGSEDGVKQMRKTITAIGSGIIILILRQSLNYALGLKPPDEGASPANPVPQAIVFIDTAFRVISFFLGFVALIAVLILIYAGIRLILSVGNQDAMKEAKGLLTRALVGFFIIIISLALVTFVIQLA